MLVPSPCPPKESALTRVTMPLIRSRTKTSCMPFVSPATRFEALETNATYVPSPEISAP
jgi:hypothetical protein